MGHRPEHPSRRRPDLTRIRNGYRRTGDRLVGQLFTVPQGILCGARSRADSLWSRITIVWRTSDGVMHTVAMPEPGVLFTAPALDTVLSVLADLDEERLDALVEDLTFGTAAHWDEVEVDEAVEQAFCARPAPAWLFNTVVTDEASLAHALRQVPPRWRLDVLLAVEDLATQP